MPRSTWNGSRVTKAVKATVARHHGICAYCQHPGANSLDHIVPAHDRPDLEWDRRNWTAVHLHGAGIEGGCTIPNCVCPGNKGRGRTPFSRIVAYVRAATCTCDCTCGARTPSTLRRGQESREW